jgi:hypothetical protein
MRSQVRDELAAYYETLFGDIAAKISHLNFTAVLREKMCRREGKCVSSIRRDGTDGTQEARTNARRYENV